MVIMFKARLGGTGKQNTGKSQKVGTTISLNSPPPGLGLAGQ